MASTDLNKSTFSDISIPLEYLQIFLGSKRYSGFENRWKYAAFPMEPSGSPYDQ